MSSEDDKVINIPVPPKPRMIREGTEYNNKV